MRPRLRWSGCSATELRWLSVAGKPTTAVAAFVRPHVSRRAPDSCCWRSPRSGARRSCSSSSASTSSSPRAVLLRIGLRARWRSPCSSGSPAHRFAALRPYLLPLALLGALNNAVPFWLLAWGQQHIDSGLAAISSGGADLHGAPRDRASTTSQRVTGLAPRRRRGRLRRRRAARRLPAAAASSPSRARSR